MPVVLPRDFRPTTVTRWDREGKKRKGIMAMTGHTTESMFHRYRKLLDEDMCEVVGRDPHPSNGQKISTAARHEAVRKILKLKRIHDKIT